jgi:hypothetical protein
LARRDNESAGTGGLVGEVLGITCVVFHRDGLDTGILSVSIIQIFRVRSEDIKRTGGHFM